MSFCMAPQVRGSVVSLEGETERVQQLQAAVPEPKHALEVVAADPADPEAWDR